MRILVVGSTNIDHVSYLETFPKIGETIKTTRYLTNLGGKGANQAVALAKLSNLTNEISFFSHVGQEDKKLISEELASYKIDCQYLFPVKNVPTGVANIFVSRLEKNNFIAVASLANSLFSKEAMKKLELAIKVCDYVLLQLEINHKLVEKTLKLAKKFKKLVVLNPSPISELNVSYLKYVDWLILNETELEHLTSININNLKILDQQIKIVKSYGVKNVIVTLGPDGCYIASKKLSKHIKPSANNIKVIDSTAAGDTFTGAFVAQLGNMDLQKAVEFAMQSAELAIQKKGAQISIPTYKEVNNAQRSIAK